jgi:hypothetical protein
VIVGRKLRVEGFEKWEKILEKSEKLGKFVNLEKIKKFEENSRSLKKIN